MPWRVYLDEAGAWDQGNWPRHLRLVLEIGTYREERLLKASTATC